jgi:hypothetical protein
MYDTASTSPSPVTPRRHRKWAAVLGIAAIIVTSAVAGIAVGAANSTRHVPGPRVTVTQEVPGPVRTETIIQTVPAPPPPAGTVLDTFHGTGSQVTPAFNVPPTTDYVVKWSYSANLDTSFGSATPANFAIGSNGSGTGDLPDDIAAAGSGSTEVTGAGSADSLNVEATGNWTIVIVSA